MNRPELFDKDNYSIHCKTTKIHTCRSNYSLNYCTQQSFRHKINTSAREGATNRLGYNFRQVFSQTQQDMFPLSKSGILSEKYDIYTDITYKAFTATSLRYTPDTAMNISYFLDDKEISEQFEHSEGNIKYFYSSCLLHLLADGESVTADGTWAPVRYNSYYQCYILLSNIRREGFAACNVPVLYYFLPGKSEASYNQMWSITKKVYKQHLGIDLNIRSIIIDLEFSAVKSIEKAFPNTKITLCRFHCIQAFKSNFVKKFNGKWFTWRLMILLQVLCPNMWSCIQS